MKAMFAFFVAALLPALAHAQEAAAPPKISEIMVQQQMRHIKLWFAGHGGNWPLADYELDALQNGFEDLNQQLGGDVVEKAVGVPLSVIAKAIETKDRAAFTSAYDNLTAGCNTCHHSLGHAFIVIQRPASSPYSDQFFATQK